MPSGIYTLSLLQLGGCMHTQRVDFIFIFFVSFAKGESRERFTSTPLESTASTCARRSTGAAGEGGEASDASRACVTAQSYTERSAIEKPPVPLPVRLGTLLGKISTTQSYLCLSSH